jgi:hypothetical protein
MYEVLVLVAGEYLQSLLYSGAALLQHEGEKVTSGSLHLHTLLLLLLLLPHCMSITVKLPPLSFRS